jgi:hypothetical protein
VPIRETINQNPKLTGIVAGVIALSALFLIVWNLLGSQGNAQKTYWGKTFFSDDDGQTWFIDDASHLPPFDHNGKTAYRAVLYRCGSGKPFVAYLGKYSDAQFARMDEMKKEIAARDPGEDPERLFNTIPMDVKKPGDSKWAPGLAPKGGVYDARAYEKVTTVVCPQDAGTPVMVQVSDSDVQ